MVTTRDQEFAALLAAGYSGTIADMRRASMLASLGLTSSIETNTDLEARIYRALGYTASINTVRAMRKRGTLLNPLTDGPASYSGCFAGDPQWANPGNEGSVDSWRSPAGDLSNTGGSVRPTYRLDAVNGQPGVVFSAASSQYVQVDIANVNQTFYAVWLGTLLAVDSNTRAALGIGAGTTTGIGVRSINTWYTSATTPLDSGISANTLPHLYYAALAGASSELWVDNVLAASGNSGTSAAQWFSIGAGTTSIGGRGNYWNGTVSFAALYTVDPKASSKWPVILQVARDHGVNV